MKKTPLTPSTATLSRQISKKFHSYIIARLTETCGLLTNGDAIKSATLLAIEKYISESIISAKSLPREILLIFTILRPEIDRAIERSAKARCRVRKHPSAPEQAVPTPIPSNTDSTNRPKRFSPNGPLMLNDSLTAIPASLHSALSATVKTDETDEEITDEMVDKYILNMPFLNRRQRRFIQQKCKRR
ncbi:hypothetical protein [uncultured Duncaniella sp.]|uniref:hypothetical protein n=1 Tax=uncultured Duncaniella sp. TaxID=2768039 RepID=UPI0025ECD485|nr:hypothetical protein [uncultured Duncaniella sp.]